MLNRVLAVATVLALIFLFTASAYLDEADIEDSRARTVEEASR